MVWTDPKKEYGCLVLGSLFTSFLSGLTTLQALIYFRLFSQDPKHTKAVVVFVWLLDFLHTAFMWQGIWYYVVENFGDESKVEFVPYCLPVAAIITALITITTHCFYVLRIFHLSGKKYWIAAPIFFVAFSRMCTSFVANSIFLRIKYFPYILVHFSWAVTVPLSLACVTDVLIVISMFALLRMSRDSALTLHHVIDRLVLYTFEIGTLTGCAVIVAMICWLTVPNKLIYIGIYFPIAKFYANSLLASLNARHHLRNMRMEGFNQLPVYLTSMNFCMSKRSSDTIHAVQDNNQANPKVEVIEV